MRNIKQALTIAKLTIEENIRKKILYILLFLSFALIAFSASFSAFDLGAQVTIMKDISLSGIALFGIVLTLSLFLNVIPKEIETKTIYPFITQPITRGTYLTGKYIGLMTIISVNIFILGLELMGVMKIYSDNWNVMIINDVILNILQCGIIGGLMLLFSLFTSYPLTLSITVFLYILGGISTPYIQYLQGKLPKILLDFVVLIKLIIPKFDCFNIKDAVVHMNALPHGYFSWATLYGISYILITVIIATILFEKKDL